MTDLDYLERLGEPLEEREDWAWSEVTPARPARRQVAGEWSVEPWSFMVPDGWEDLSSEQPAKRPKVGATPARRLPPVRADRPRRGKGTDGPAPAPERSLPCIRLRPVQAPEPPPAPPERPWTGLVNAWAQACLYCGSVVPVGAGTWRRAPGGWEARHWSCRTAP